MSYKLFIDKLNTFECKLQVEGTSLNKAQARVILETPSLNYLFKGKINESGTCEFELPKLKGILDEGATGTVRMEVIADDVHFEPWSSAFIVEANKKVTVTIQEQETAKKPAIVMSEITLTQAKPIVEEKETPAPVVKEEKAPVEKTTSASSKTVITKDDLIKFVKSKK